MPPTPADALTALDYAVVDVETTGLYPQSGDRICEVAVLRRRRGRTVDTFQTLVNPQRRISPGAAQVNHLTDRDVADAPTFEQIAPRLVSMLDGAVLVAHNAPFDLGFLANEWQRLRWPPRTDFVVDTLALARRLYACPSNSLAAVARRLGVPRSQAHRALGDVQTTARILDRMLGDLQRRGALTLGDALDWQGGNVPWPGAPRVPGLAPPRAGELRDMIHRLRLLVDSTRPTPDVVQRTHRPATAGSHLNLSLRLSERLADLPAHQRTLHAPTIVADLLRSAQPRLVDQIELLFEPTLHLDPLRLLQSVSRQVPLLVAWPGTYDPSTGTLTYAVPDHPEYRRYRLADLPGIMIVDTAALEEEE